MELKGKIAFVTGSTRGIGLATAKAFIREGAEVIIHGTDAHRAKQVADELDTPGRHYSVSGDVSCLEDVVSMFDAVKSRFDRLDILVNNAGIPGIPRAFMDVSPDEWIRMMNINLNGVYYCCREGLKIMAPRKYGKIVNLSSRAGESANLLTGHCADYSVAKAGVITLTKSLAKEYISLGINVNAVAPGPIATDMLPAEVHDKISPLIPAGRLAEAWEVAEAILYLVKDASSFIVGEVLDVNGGTRL